MPTATSSRIVGVGSALVDVLSHIPEHFLQNVQGAKGGMELISAADMARLLATLPAGAVRIPGGSAANTIVGICRLGIPGRLLSKVGDDEAGKFYVAHAAKAGVETSTFKIDPGEVTGTCISLVTPDSQRTMRTYLGVGASISVADIGIADFTGCTHAHVEGYILYNLPYALHVLELAKRAGCVISLDLAAPEVVAATDNLPALLQQYVDIVMANEDEAAAFCGSESELAAVAALAEC